MFSFYNQLIIYLCEIRDRVRLISRLITRSRGLARLDTVWYQQFSSLWKFIAITWWQVRAHISSFWSDVDQVTISMSWSKLLILLPIKFMSFASMSEVICRLHYTTWRFHLRDNWLSRSTGVGPEVLSWAITVSKIDLSFVWWPARVFRSFVGSLTLKISPTAIEYELWHSPSL